MDKLRQALIEVASENQMPTPQGGVLGGGWQWLWYAPGSSDRIWRVDVSGEPRSDGLVVSGHLLNWNRTGEREPIGETWYSHFYRFDEAEQAVLVEHLREKLKAAWASAVEASVPAESR